MPDNGGFKKSDPVLMRPYVCVSPKMPSNATSQKLDCTNSSGRWPVVQLSFHFVSLLNKEQNMMALNCPFLDISGDEQTITLRFAEK